MGLGGQRQAPAALSSETRIHCTGAWVVPRAGLDLCGKSRPARIESLYLLRYPVHRYLCKLSIILFDFLPDFNLVINWSLAKEKCNMKFQENPSSWFRVVPFGQTDMKLTVAFAWVCERA